MGRVTAVCGKICCGKTYFCNELIRKRGGVLLSCDEISTMIFRQQLGDKHDETMLLVKEYLHKKAAEIAQAGCDVILDWGFWQREERRAAAQYYRARGVELEWHYISISDDDWFRNITERNRKIESGISQDYYIDEGLLKKALSLFEAPEPDELEALGFTVYEFIRKDVLKNE